MKVSFLLICYFISFSLFSNAQIVNDSVLLSINETPIYSSEFIRIYNKNLNLVKEESQQNIDEYLKLFINYKLKIEEARVLGYDKTASLKKELRNYREQLAKKYLTDHEVTEDLVKEAYERIKYDIKASHVLVSIPEYEKDTIQAYSQILKLRERLINDGFESVRDEFHDGNSIFAEDLGYFSGFKMVYDFENVVYNTNVNEVSQPFRTQFGYHVVKVFDKRKTRGEVTIGHIMTSFNKNDTLLNSEGRINEIYNLIKQGENFENLAKQFSDDANSAKRGGKLNPFKSGDLGSQSFENTAFALNNIGEISKPFKSDFGWHIIKLYEKKPLESFETLKHKLEIEVKRDSRSERINTALINKLLGVYHINKYDNSDLPDFISIFEKNLLNKNWNITFNLSQNKVLFKIRQNEYKYTDFVEFLKESEKRNLEKNELDTYVSSKYKTFINESILNYYKDNLHLENLEFANTIKEFEEGLLLFELMEAKVWNSGKNDSIELMKFYENNKSNYILKERIDAIIARSSSEKTSEYLQKLWLKNDDIDVIKKELNQNGKQNVLFTKDIVSKDHSIIPVGFNFKKGVSNVYYHNDAYYVIRVNKILPKRTKTFDEASGNVVSDFQAQKEVDLLDSLAKKYKIKINNNVLNNIKTQLLLN